MELAGGAFLQTIFKKMWMPDVVRHDELFPIISPSNNKDTITLQILI